MLTYYNPLDGTESPASLEVIELARKARGLQGNEAFHSGFTATSHHEAGHTVINSVIGHPSTLVWIKPHHSGNWTGMTYFPDDHPWRTTFEPRLDPDRAIAVVAVAIAGRAAEMVFEGDKFRLGSSLDEVYTSQQWAKTITPDQGSAAALYDAVLSTVRKILEQERDAVLAVASLLRREGRARGP
ncbi:MAG: hypothetical protein ACLPXB_13440, partial [Thiobacillaceae bacterium]